MDQQRDVECNAENFLVLKEKNQPNSYFLKSSRRSENFVFILCVIFLF